MSTGLTHPEFPGIQVPAVPAPWTLEGRGYMLLYRLKPEHRARLGHHSSAARGLATVMLVDYASSNAGAYRELLYIPGKLATPHGNWHRITRIYVSTMDSVINGRQNWAIPKHPAAFDFEPRQSGEVVTVTRDGQPVFQASFQARGPAFPVSTRLLPFPLLQPADGQDAWLQTTFSGTGRGRLARVEDMQVSGAAFPDLADIKPLAVIAVDPFRISFPVARPVR